MSRSSCSLRELENHNAVVGRHIGPREVDKRAMLNTLALASMDELISKVVPESILQNEPLDFDIARLLRTKSNATFGLCFS